MAEYYDIIEASEMSQMVIDELREEIETLKKFIKSKGYEIDENTGEITRRKDGRAKHAHRKS